MSFSGTSYRRTMPRRQSRGMGCYVLLGVVVLALVGGFIAFLDYRKEEVVTCHVTGRDRTTKSDGSGSDARIYTSDCGTMVVGDSLIKFRFNSGNVYGSILPDHTYKFTRFGWRIPFFSVFPNILKAEQVS